MQQAQLSAEGAALAAEQAALDGQLRAVLARQRLLGDRQVRRGRGQGPPLVGGCWGTGRCAGGVGRGLLWLEGAGGQAGAQGAWAGASFGWRVLGDRQVRRGRAGRQGASTDWKGADTGGRGVCPWAGVTQWPATDCAGTLHVWVRRGWSVDHSRYALHLLEPFLPYVSASRLVLAPICAPPTFSPPQHPQLRLSQQHLEVLTSQDPDHRTTSYYTEHQPLFALPCHAAAAVAAARGVGRAALAAAALHRRGAGVAAAAQPRLRAAADGGARPAGRRGGPCGHEVRSSAVALWELHQGNQVCLEKDGGNQVGTQLRVCTCSMVRLRPWWWGRGGPHGWRCWPGCHTVCTGWGPVGVRAAVRWACLRARPCSWYEDLRFWKQRLGAVHLAAIRGIGGGCRVHWAIQPVRAF